MMACCLENSFYNSEFWKNPALLRKKRCHPICNIHHTPLSSKFTILRFFFLRNQKQPYPEEKSGTKRSTQAKPWKPTSYKHHSNTARHSKSPKTTWKWTAPPRSTKNPNTFHQQSTSPPAPKTSPSTPPRRVGFSRFPTGTPRRIPCGTGDGALFKAPSCSSGIFHPMKDWIIPWKCWIWNDTDLVRLNLSIERGVLEQGLWCWRRPRVEVRGGRWSVVGICYMLIIRWSSGSGNLRWRRLLSPSEVGRFIIIMRKLFDFCNLYGFMFWFVKLYIIGT